MAAYRRALKIFAVLGLCCAATVARAEGPPRREPAGYKSAVNAGIDEFDRGNITEAREHFTRAHALYPNARTLRGLGMSEFELRNYVEAVEKLEQALDANERRLEGRLRSETEALLARARAYVGELELALSPSTTSVRVDGFPVPLGPEQRLRLAVGDHVLEFSADGHLPDQRAIKILGEQRLRLEVTLRAPVVIEPVGPRRTEPLAVRGEPRQDAPTPLYKRWWLWTGVGAVVIGGVVAGVLLSMRDPRTQDPNGGSTGDTLFVE